MQVIYMAFGGLCILAGVIELAAGTKIAGVTTIVFGAIIFSLSAIVDRIAVLEGKLAELEGATPRARPEPAAAPKAEPPASTEPAREPTADEVEAAKALLATAQDHHFAKRFVDAREVYAQIVERYGATKQAATARQQLENLRGL
jgi:predicted lipid-binding transport protein (Tim44 family)